MPSVEYTRPLAALRHTDEARFGGKSTGLGELLAARIAVPPGFAIATAAFETFVAEAGLDATIAAALASVAPDDMDGLAAASAAIGAAMRSAAVPPAVRAQVANSYELLAEVVGDATPAVAVRSSALGEDSEDATFAGQQDTYLWVRGVEEICDAVRDCWASLYSPPAISYRARLGGDHGLAAMGVAVQLMVDAETAGVMFTCNPISGDPSMVAINASWGLGLAVVGGEVTPDDYLVSKITGEVVRERIGRKQIQYVVDPAARGALAVAVPGELQSTGCLDRAALEALVAVAKRVESHFGSHQDVEWAIARAASAAEGLFVVQSRPVTALPSQPSQPKPMSAMSLVMSTFGAVDPKRDS